MISGNLSTKVLLEQKQSHQKKNLHFQIEKLNTKLMQIESIKKYKFVTWQLLKQLENA